MKSTAYEFARDVDEQIEALDRDDYLRHDKPAKLLLEEWYPISRLALHFKRPGLEVKVEAFEDNEAADGRIWMTGYLKEQFDIQVTCCFDGEEFDKMRNLAAEGSFVGSAREYDKHIKSVAEIVADRFQDKSSKFAYVSETILVISFSEARIYGLKGWDRLLCYVDNKGEISESDFESVYLFNAWKNEIQKAV